MFSIPGEVVFLDARNVLTCHHFLDCPPDFYWNKVVSGPLSNGVAFQFPFLLHKSKPIRGSNHKALVWLPH